MQTRQHAGLPASQCVGCLDSSCTGVEARNALSPQVPRRPQRGVSSSLRAAAGVLWTVSVRLLRRATRAARPDGARWRSSDTAAMPHHSTSGMRRQTGTILLCFLLACNIEATLSVDTGDRVCEVAAQALQIRSTTTSTSAASAAVRSPPQMSSACACSASSRGHLRPKGLCCAWNTVGRRGQGQAGRHPGSEI